MAIVKLVRGLMGGLITLTLNWPLVLQTSTNSDLAAVVEYGLHLPTCGKRPVPLNGDIQRVDIDITAICMVSGVAVYPAGWSDTIVQETCGPTADQYHLGRCHIRWAYLLAVIGCLDGLVLAALAFILATRHVRLQSDSGYPPPSLYKGEVNNAYVTDATSVSGSRKSLALQPVLIMHPHATMDMDTYSHYSGRTARSKHGIYANTMHNYQL